MARTYINPGTISSPGGRYTHVVRSGNMLFISGQVSVDAAGNVVGAGDIEAQARQVYKNLEFALKAAGGSLSDIVKVTTYLTTRDSAAGIGKVRQEVWKNDPPASTLLIISGLANPAFLIEIDAIAVLSDR